MVNLSIVAKEASKAPTLAKEVAQFFRRNPKADMHVITEGVNKGFYMREGGQIEHVVTDLTRSGKSVTTKTRYGLDDLRLTSADVQNQGNGAKLNFNAQKPDEHGIIGRMQVESGEGDTFIRNYYQNGTVLDVANVAGVTNTSYVEGRPLDNILIMLEKFFLHG